MHVSLLWNATKNTVVTCALTHVAILFFIAFREHSIQTVNIFSIMDISYFFPVLTSGIGMFIVSWIFLAILFGFWFVKATKKL